MVQNRLNSPKVTKKVLVFQRGARSCSKTKKLLKILKVTVKLPSRIWIGLLMSSYVCARYNDATIAIFRFALPARKVYQRNENRTCSQVIWGITTEFIEFIPQSLVLRSVTASFFI